MDREKRIEEMTKCCIYNDNGKCNADATESNECDLMCKMYGMFANLEMAGYLKQREGEWVETQREWNFEPYFYTDYTCSVCGDREQDKRHFCPNCGAKMIEECDD